MCVWQDQACSFPFFSCSRPPSRDRGSRCAQLLTRTRERDLRPSGLFRPLRGLAASVEMLVAVHHAKLLDIDHMTC
jgi:hypothetical protein